MTQVDALIRLATQLARGPASLSFPASGELPDTLTIGQIIKGRVLRSFDTRRYLVDFGGEPRVVDSAVPLRPDEVFHGRVVGLGERVLLHKLGNEAQLVEQAEATALPQAHSEDSLAALFARYRAQVPPEQLEAAASQAARLPQPAMAGLAALVLAKIGLPLEPLLIRALHARLLGRTPAASAADALQLEAVPPAPSLSAAAVPALGAALQAALADALHAQRPASGQTDDGRRPPRDPATRLLNVQTGGAVAQHLGTVALHVGGRLLELEIAFFDEHAGSPEAASTAPRHRQIVIALDTEALGHVVVRASLAGQRMAVELATTASDRTLALSLHQQQLREGLEALGFEVDRLAYATESARLPNAPAAPVQAIVEHLITPGSVDRRI